MSRRPAENKRPHFFKIIHSSIIQDRQLELPRKFVRKFGEDISDAVVLKVQNGTTWEIKLRKDDGAVWFQNGLKEFLEYYSICSGHFLVFRYDGQSQFYVLIFDMTGSEIDYCHIYDNYGEPNLERMLLGPKSEVEQTDSAPTRSASSRCLVPFTRENFAALEKANSFESSYPFFTAVMRPAYMGHRFLHIPHDFIKKYLSENLNSIKLQSLDGRTYATGCRYSGKHIRISKGWSAFMFGNDLQVGDVCVFELVNKEIPMLRAHVFKAEQKISCGE